MGASVDTAAGMPDSIKWMTVVLLMGGAIGAFYYYGDESLLLRVIGLLVVAGACIAVAVQTEKGRIAWELIRDSHTEVRKVVWPTRKETFQTTLIVIAMVSVVAIVLWMLDGLLGWAVRALLRQGG